MEEFCGYATCRGPARKMEAAGATEAGEHQPAAHGQSWAQSVARGGLPGGRGCLARLAGLRWGRQLG